MITLTQVAAYTRKGIRWSIFALIIFLFLKTALTFSINYWKALHPPPPPPPNSKFGKLKAIEFPPPKFPYPLNFTLETIEGGLPEGSPSAKVLFMPKKLPSLLASAKAKKFAANLGFTNEPQQLSRINYRFFDPEYPSRTLELNIINNNFFLEYDYKDDPSVFYQSRPPSKNQAINEAKSFFINLGLWSKDLDGGRITTTLVRFEKGKLIPASSISKTQAVRVDFFRKDIDKWPIVSPFYKESLVYAIITGSGNIKKKIIEAKYIHPQIDYENYATYPLKSSQKAWEELLSGFGFISNLEGESQEIIIRKVYLGFFETEEEQNFLQPVFVFEGDEEFVAYVSAIEPEWIE